MKIYRIGRSHDNDIIFNDARVSEHHAEIAISDNGSAIFTDYSKNGTMVNGELIMHTSVPVHIDDLIFLPGNLRLDISRYFR